MYPLVGFDPRECAGHPETTAGNRFKPRGRVVPVFRIEVQWAYKAFFPEHTREGHFAGVGDEADGSDLHAAIMPPVTRARHWHDRGAQ